MANFAEARLPLAREFYEINGILLYGYKVVNGVVEVDVTDTFWEACGVTL